LSLLCTEKGECIFETLWQMGSIYLPHTHKVWLYQPAITFSQSTLNSPGNNVGNIQTHRTSIKGVEKMLKKAQIKVNG